VREPDEVLQGSIPSSVNLPLSTLASSLALDKATFKERFGFKKPETANDITFYCRSGRRSASAADVAKRNGYTKYVASSLLFYCTDLLSKLKELLRLMA
jgi:thiosulfate:glutathione sulfurtransferase